MSQQINLFNPIFLQKKKYFSALTMVQALGMIVLGTALVCGYAAFELSRLRPEARALSAQLEAAQSQLTVVQAQAERRKDVALEADLQRTEADVRALQRVAASLRRNETGVAVDGFSDYMRAFARQIVDGLWLTGFSVTEEGRQISLSGAALRPELVPTYLGRLGRERALQGKAFDMLEMNEASEEGRAVQSAGAVVFRLGTAAMPQDAGMGGMTP